MLWKRSILKRSAPSPYDASEGWTPPFFFPNLSMNTKRAWRRNSRRSPYILAVAYITVKWLFVRTSDRHHTSKIKSSLNPFSLVSLIALMRENSARRFKCSDSRVIISVSRRNRITYFKQILYICQLQTSWNIPIFTYINNNSHGANNQAWEFRVALNSNCNALQ